MIDAVTSPPIFVPPDPVRLLLLVPGHPWPDGSRTDEQLREYAAAMVEQWRPFAARHAALVVAPVFGTLYPDFREGGGAADYVVALTQRIIGRYLPDSDGRFALHGHSAGAQFAVRFLVAHADRLSDAIISAPSEYAFPATGVPWPHGAAGAPDTADWVAAAARVRVTVLVGSRDLEPRPAAPGHGGATRPERARAWVAAMRQLATDGGIAPTIDLRTIDGVDHDEITMGQAAREILTGHWR